MRNALLLLIPVAIVNVGAVMGNNGSIVVMLAIVIMATITGMFIRLLGVGAEIKLRKFAEQNGLKYSLKMPCEDREGMIFVASERQWLENVLIFEGVSRLPIEIGTHISYGKRDSRRGRFYGFICITLPHYFPQMVLDARANNMLQSATFTNLPQVFAEGQRHSLGMGYDEHFTLYADPRELAAVSHIFSSALLDALLASKQGRFYDYEVIDDKFYGYTPSNQHFALHRIDRLQEVLEFASKVASILGGQVEGRSPVVHAAAHIQNEKEPAPPPPRRRLGARLPMLRAVLWMASVAIGGYLMYGVMKTYPLLDFFVR